MLNRTAERPFFKDFRSISEFKQEATDRTGYSVLHSAVMESREGRDGSEAV
jgi:hypothetical protein